MRISRLLPAFILSAALLSLPAAVRAASPTLVSIEVTPAAVAVSTGSAALFTAVGTFSDASTRTLNGTWTSRAQMLESRTDSVGAFSGSKLFVFGGSSSPGFPFGTFNSEAYDAAADSWSVRSAAPVRRGGAFAAEYAGKIYVAGGCINADCNTLTTAVWEYDVALDSWTAKTALPGARFDAAMQQIDGKIYVAGGIMAGFVSTNTVHMYDPAADTWTARAPMPAARGLGASGAINGKLYVAGGRIDGGAVTGAEMQIYDPVANAWSLGAAMPSGRMATAGGVVNGRLYVVAGVSDPTAPTVADSERVQIYDPASNTWIEGSSITARYGPVVGSYEGKLYAAGAGFNNVATSSVQVLNADEAVWSSNAPTIGTVTASGSASGLTAGVAQITATSGAVSGFGTLTVDGPPAAPSAFAGAAQSTTSILWSWTDNSSNETGFRVMSGLANLSGNLPAGTTIWLQTGLTPNATSGTLFARAYNSTGTADSGSLTLYSLTDPPNSISATFFGSSVAFTWPTMSNPAPTLWSVERGTDGVSYASQLYFSSAAAAFTDTGLGAQTTYYYRVRSANSDGVYSIHANAWASVYTGGTGYPGCTTTANVGAGQTYATIQGGVNALPASMAGPSCVVIRDGATYAEQVTVRNFTNNGHALSILADPGSGLIPVVAPPAASTAAFLIANASVSVQGLMIAPGADVAYGIYSSSAQVSITSVTITTGTGSFRIWEAGMRLASWNRVSYSSVSIGAAYGFELSSGSFRTAISYSTAAVSSSLRYALYLLVSDSNTVTGSYFSNPSGHGAEINLSNYNTISQSTVTSAGPGALTLAGADFNTVTGSFISNSVGWGASLIGGSDYNTINLSTIAGGPTNFGFRIVVSASNTVTGCYLTSSSHTPVAFETGADHNVISQSTIAASATGGYGLVMVGGSFNTVTQSRITNTFGIGAGFYMEPTRNTISLSTIVVTGGEWHPGVYFGWGSGTNTVTGSYVQSSTGVHISGASGAVIEASVLVGGPLGPGVFLGDNNTGAISLSSITVTGARYGLVVATQAAALSIDSMNFAGLAAGATAVRFLGGTFVATFTAASFDASVGVNVDASPLNAASRITMNSHSGARTGSTYENDPNSLVDWGALAYPGCAVTANVGSGQTYATIQGGIDALPASLTGPSCVVIRDGASYPEALTVRNFTTNGHTLSIFADPGSGLTPTITAPVAAQAAIVVANSSVTMKGFNLAPSSSMPYGIFVSSAYVTISSVNVQDSSGKITIAAIVASSWSTISYASVTAGGSNVAAFWLPGSTKTSLTDSWGVVSGSAAYGMRLTNANSNTISDLFIQNLPGIGAQLINSNYNSISGSSIACNNGTGIYAALYLSSASFNTVSRTYVRNWFVDAIALNNSSHFNTISQSTAVLNGAGGQAAIGLNSSHYNAVTGCMLTASGGVGINIGASHYNTVSQTTMTITNGMGSHALRFNVSSSNTVTQCHVHNPGDTAVAYQNGSAYNAISQSVIVGGYSSNLYPAGVYLQNGSYNTITLSRISNPTAYGAIFGQWGIRNTISLSTITSADSGHSAVYFMSGSGTNTLTGSYVQGASTAAYLTGAISPTISSSVLVGGALGAALYLDRNNSGTIVVSSSTMSGARYGLLITTQAMTALLPTTLNFTGLAAGATAINFTGGTVVATFTAAGFDASAAVNVNAAPLNAASRATMLSYSGARGGAAFENDPSSLVDWIAGTPPAAPTGFAGAAQSASTILWSWTDNSSTETGFRVMAGATNVSGDLAADATSWLQSGLGVNTSSGSLLVQVFNSTGTGNSASVTRYSLAAVPDGLASSGVGLGAASISWTANGNPGGTLYAVERSTGTGFGLRQSSAALSFIDTTLSPASTYYYRTRALNADAAATAYASTITVVTPVAPVFLTVSTMTPSSAASGPSAAVAAVGTGFDGTAVLTLERASAGAGVWTATGSFTQARMLGTLTKLGDGRVLLAGGMLEGAAPGLTASDIFNPATGGWTATGALVQGRQQHAAVLLTDGRVLAAGGAGPSGTATRTAEIYDPASGVWTAVSSMTYARSGHAMTLLADGRVLAAGGNNGAGPHPTAAEVYDPAADAWSPAGSLATVHDLYPTMTMLRTGKVLLTGGDTAAGAATAELYDPAGNSWSATGSMADSHFEHQAVMLPDGRVLAAGGRSGPTATAAVYDPGTGAWTATSTMAAARFQHGMVLVAGVPLAIGGLGAAAALTSTEIYDAGLNAWRAGPALNVARYSALSVALNDGKILVAGGRTGGAGAPNTNTSEVLVLPFTQITATGLSVSNAQNLSGSVSLAGAATGYWDAVVRQSGGRTGRLPAGFLVLPEITTPTAPSGFAGAAQSASSILWTWTDNASTEDGFRVVSGTISVSGNLAANATSWLQSGLGGNALTGPYAAQAYNAGGTIDSSTASRTTLAAAPAGLAASGVYQTSATVNWSQGTNAAGTTFELERSTGTGYGQLLSAAATYYFDGNLAPGATHYYRVRAINGESLATAYSSSIAVVAVPPPAVPGAAGTPAGTALGISSISWTWALASGATNHFLYRASDGAFLNQQATVPFVQTGLSGNTAYGLRIAGVNLGGLGPLSAAATAYTWAAVPSGAAAVSIASTSLTASWGLNGNSAATVAQLDRSSDAVVYSTLTIAAVTAYADADLLGCTTYYYRVRNANAAGVLSAYASFQGVTANTVADPPAGLTASANGGGSVSLAWGLSPTEGVTGYRLYWDAGSGSVNFAAPLAVLGSTATAYTTGVLTSSASYTFALRTAHRCGTIETTGALAMSGAAVAPPEVRAAIKEPDSGRRVSGNSLTILAELTAGTPSDVQQIVFQFKTDVSTAWANINAVYLDHPNPDFAYPYFTHVNVTGWAAGSYDLRAVAYNRDGVPDSAPPAVRVVVDHTSPDISEGLTAAGEIKKDQVVSNAVVSVVETAGADAADPAVRVTIPAGTVNSATATVSVIANPAITTAAPSGQSLVGSAIKINLSNGQTALNGTAAISLTYPDTVRFPALLQIFYLDEATGQWSRDFASTVNTTSRTVSGNTPHFSTFALLLGTAFAANLDSVRVYPVPYKPNGRDPDEGRPFTAGDPNSGILFSNLAQGAEIKIYTLTGRLVSSLDNAPITGTVRWDAKNQDGRDAASGAYFAVITATGQKSIVKKLVIIR